MPGTFQTRCEAKKFRIWQANRHLTAHFGRPATRQEIADFTGYRLHTVNYWFKGHPQPRSVRRRFYDSDDYREKSAANSTAVLDLVSIFERNDNRGYSRS